jgi:hypothetical protein
MKVQSQGCKWNRTILLDESHKLDPWMAFWWGSKTKKWQIDAKPTWGEGRGHFARFLFFLVSVLNVFPLMFPIASHFLCHMLSARGYLFWHVSLTKWIWRHFWGHHSPPIACGFWNHRLSLPPKFVHIFPSRMAALSAQSERPFRHVSCF